MTEILSLWEENISEFRNIFWGGMLQSTYQVYNEIDFKLSVSS